ncbi:MAG: hypothetical protein N5P05_000050 [Chroococcopsis gigantea SAG 12.99]|nr:hypothetical protein [Chlorogloea purpurea SAG 13.99]MDV2998444.1 hypothetical protein [Chroococcopsis gigantea SAG 12.99]
MFKIIYSLALLSAATISAALPVHAEILVSQLRGHETYAKEPQMNMSDYVVGRVRGAVGGILSVQFYQPVTVGNREVKGVNVSGGATPGDDVIFQIIDDKLVFVGPAHPYWVTRLKIKPES